MLELKNISYSVTEEGITKQILDDISLSIPDSKLTVITGPNGGGKSTLAKVIAGIIKPDSGKIIFDGEDITDMSVTDRARKGIGFAFQQPVKFKGVRVIDLLRLATGIKNLSAAEACKYLAAVGLCARDYVDREVNASLSGGELKRIEIAEILSRATELSIFDEPEAGIDLWSFNNLIKVFEDMRRNIKDSSVVIISHQERILNVADEIVVINNGKVDRHGKKEDIYPTLLGSSTLQNFCTGASQKEEI